VFCFWPLAHNQNDAIGFCVSLGICLGVIIGIPASCIAHIIPQEQMGYLGAWTGLMWSSCSLFALAGPPIAGYCVKNFGIVAVGYWTGINFALASISVVLAMVTNRKRDISRVVEVRSEDGRMEKPEITR
jgi:MFS family permease